MPKLGWESSLLKTLSTIPCSVAHTCLDQVRKKENVPTPDIKDGLHVLDMQSVVKKKLKGLCSNWTNNPSDFVCLLINVYEDRS